MTDAQIIAAAVTAGFAALAAAIRWGVKRLAAAQDASTAALVRNAESHGQLAAKFDALADRIVERFDQLAGEITGRALKTNTGNRPRKARKIRP